MANLVNTWGLFPWFQEYDKGLIHPDDLYNFQPQNSSVFFCIGIEDKYLVLQQGKYEYRVIPTNYKVIYPPKFSFGMEVLTTNGDVAYIEEIHWHHKDKRHIYLLIKDGRKLKRRFYEEELNGVS